MFFLIITPAMAIVDNTIDISWMLNYLTSGNGYNNVHTCWSPQQYLQFIYPDKVREEIAWVAAVPCGFLWHLSILFLSWRILDFMFSLHGFAAATAEAIFPLLLELLPFDFFFSQLLFVLPPSQQLVTLQVLWGVYSPWKDITTSDHLWNTEIHSELRILQCLMRRLVYWQLSYQRACSWSYTSFICPTSSSQPAWDCQRFYFTLCNIMNPL